MLTPRDIEAAPLTEGSAIRKMQDGNGLFLQIGSKSKGWRLRYKFAGKDALISLGPYPAVSLDSARDKASAARKQLADGVNPARAREEVKDAEHRDMSHTFGFCADAFNRVQHRHADKTRERHQRMFKHSARLHDKPLKAITRADIVALCRSFETTGRRETAHRLAIYIAQVYRQAADEWYTGPNPTLDSISKSLHEPRNRKKRPALTDPLMVGALMRDLDHGNFRLIGANVRNAIRVLARTLLRPGELAGAMWRELDLDGRRHDGAPTWVIPRSRMKMKDPERPDHIVPLSTQCVAILREQFELTGHGTYVFTNGRSGARPMSDGAMSACLDRLLPWENIEGGKPTPVHVPHGFRRTGKTLIQDALKIESELVERQLDHLIGSQTASAYDSSQRLPERRAMLQAYSDLLERLKAGA